MATPVIMPKFEMSQETATVVEWLKQEGEEVKKGEPLLTVETDKVTMDVEVPATGILAGVQAAPGQVVPVTQVIAYILQPGEELGESANQQISKSANQQITPLSPLPLVPSPPLPRFSASATPVARRLAAAAGVDLGALESKGKGGKITKADVMAAAAEDLTGPAKVRATPAARRIARERGVELAAVMGSGPRGRVQVADVAPSPFQGEGWGKGPASSPSQGEGRGEGPAPSPEIGRGEVVVVPLAGMRRTIAERMTASYREAPHITFTVRVDMSGFEDVRAQFNARAEAAGVPRASVTALIVKAVAWALKRHPYLNSTLRGEEIHLLPEVNVGVAVALEQGLIVPVVHDADRKGVGEIAAEVHDLTARAREGRLVPADVAGGTFTVSNLGPFGIEQFTAIINPPQAAILAVGATQSEPVVNEEGEIVARPIMRMTLAVDHRIVDGAIAARFLADLREALEAPALILW